jgi:hypothetical protein
MMDVMDESDRAVVGVGDVVVVFVVLFLIQQ